MAKFLSRLAGTTEPSFQIGAGYGKFNQTLDTTAFTTDILWKLPLNNGSSGDVLTNDSLGNLSWQPPASAAGFVPYYIPPATTWTLPVNYQALFQMPIDVEGYLDISGYLIETLT